MRGKEMILDIFFADIGITPAYAGKSRSCRHCRTRQADHPCVCGEKILSLLSQSQMLGSPLRMRGKGSSHRLVQRLSRITPAYAGKRLKRSRKIVLFKSTVNHFHLVCNKPDTANDNLQWLGAAAWF